MIRPAGCAGLFVLLLSLAPDLQAQGLQKIFSRKKYTYQEVDAEEMIRRYVSKPPILPLSIEGIYSVSCVVTKKGKSLLSSEVKEKVKDRKDNYARVAIMRDLDGTGHDFIELSMNQSGAQTYPIVAELTTLSEGRGFLCKHVEPDGEVLTFTFTFDGDSDILEGVYTKVNGNATITYNVTYLKTFPKKAGLNQ